MGKRVGGRWMAKEGKSGGRDRGEWGGGRLEKERILSM